MSGASIEELKKAIAALFLGEGVKKMSEEQMLSVVSMKRRWFTPEKASLFIDNAKKAGMITEKGGSLSPTFPYEDIEIPFGYYPPESVLEYSGKSMLERIRDAWKLGEEEFKATVSMEYNLEDEVKLVLWGAEKGKEYSKFLEDIEKELMEKYGKIQGFT